MSKGVMIVTDNPHRELRGAYCVAWLLRARGIPARIVSKIGYQDAFELYRPRVVVLPRVTSDMARFAREAAQHAIITLIPSEYGSGFKDKVILNVLGLLPDGSRQSDSATEVVTKIYVGGTNQKNWLLEARGCTEKQIIVAGTLNSDHWMFPRRSERPSVVGIATTFKSIIMTMPVKSVPELLELHRTPEWRDTKWRVDFAAFELGYLLVLLDVLQILRDQGARISIRPHPHEFARGWERYVRAMGNGVEFDRSLRLDQWLASKCFTISSFSTTGIDSIAHGVPAISLERMVPAEYKDRLPKHKDPLQSAFSWRPETREELMDLFEKGFVGELDPSPDMAVATSYMRDNFNFPRERLAAEIIGEDLAELHQSDSRQTRLGAAIDPRVPPPAPQPGNNPLRAAALLGKRAARDVKTYLWNPSSANLYYWFSVGLRRDAKAYAADLFSAQTEGDGTPERHRWRALGVQGRKL